MKITLLTVGKVKEKFYVQAIDEFSKRLSRYCRLEIVEVADEKTPDGASDTMIAQILKKEGERLMKNIRDDAYVIALAINGQMLSSEQFAQKIEQLGIGGTSHIQFIIGGSLGLSPQVLSRADAQISFSKMTFKSEAKRS